jgi:hypothetical protein
MHLIPQIAGDDQHVLSVIGDALEHGLADIDPVVEDL